MTPAQDLAAQLLRRASEDAAAVSAMLPLESVTDAIVCFHAQQAVEKSLKAVLAAHDIDFPAKHDLRMLIGICEREDLQVPDELAEADLLTPYAAELRYDDDRAQIVDRDTALDWATGAVAWGRRTVGGEQATAVEDDLTSN